MSIIIAMNSWLPPQVDAGKTLLSLCFVRLPPSGQHCIIALRRTQPLPSLGCKIRNSLWVPAALPYTHSILERQSLAEDCVSRNTFYLLDIGVKVVFLHWCAYSLKNARKGDLFGAHSSGRARGFHLCIHLVATC